MAIKIVILSAAASLCFISCRNNTPQQQALTTAMDSVKTVTPGFVSPGALITVDEAFALSSREALIIDVREPDELAEVAYRVKNIKNIPLGELEARLAEVPKDIQVIVACKKGGRSAKAYATLKEKGFENISDMAGGMDAWQEKGLPVTKGGK